MLLAFLLSLLCFTSNAYEINNQINVDYILAYSGETMFSTALDNTYLIRETNNLENCRKNCAHNEDCLGIYVGGDNCRELSNLGEPIESINVSSSYVKISYHNLKTNEHSLVGEVWDTHTYEESLNTTIYIDLNHNGVLDIDEPYLDTLTNREFEFNNLSEGLYLIRQEIPNDCIQLYPGMNSSFGTYQGDGFVDKVTKYIHYGHHQYAFPHGSFVDGNEVLINKNFSMILGGNNDNYLSFYSNYSITLSFIDESILDNPGDDLFIDIYGHSNITANVSISSDEINYQLLGVLNTSNCTHNEHIMRQSFDLNKINYKNPVVYLKLDFFGGSRGDTINIIRAGAYERSIYLPAYGFLVEVPLKNWLFFYNDCHYYFSCYTHCALNFYYIDEYFSCNKGCELFEEQKICDCHHYNTSKNIYDYYDDDFIYYDDDFYTDDIMGDGSFDFHKCDYGCNYQMKQYVYPDYSVISDSTGLSKNIIQIDDNASIDCLIDDCNSDSLCGSFSLGINGDGSMYNSHRHTHNHNYSFLRKNNYFTSTSTTISDTSTTITDTSITDTSITDTSITETSTTETSITETSTTNTDTSITETSTTNTDTTNTDTSITDTSITDTSTTNTDTSITETSITETSTTETQTTATDTTQLYNRPSSSKSKRNLVRKRGLNALYVIIALIVISLVIFGVVRSCKRINNRPIGVVQRNTHTEGYNNPVYTTENPSIQLDETEDTSDGYYQDVEVMEVNKDYIEIDDVNSEDEEV